METTWVTLSLGDWQFQFLTGMARVHGLPDVSKALHCLSNYAAAETVRQREIFTQVRCLGADGTPGSCACSGQAEA